MDSSRQVLPSPHARVRLPPAAAGVVFLCLACASPSHPAHWGYAGEHGPEAWGLLAPEFAACAEGARQSPVDVAGARPAEDLPPLRPAYRAGPGEVVYNGHTIQVTPVDGGGLWRGDDHFRLLQYHYHRPSEHTVAGEAAALEIHLVHGDDRGSLAVLGILFDAVEGDNPALAPILAAAGLPIGDRVAVHADPAALVADDLSYTAYSGSLTTPPCTEGVAWMVLSARGGVGAEQLAALDASLEANARPVQPLRGRALLRRP